MSNPSVGIVGPGRWRARSRAPCSIREPEDRRSVCISPTSARRSRRSGGRAYGIRVAPTSKASCRPQVQGGVLRAQRRAWPSRKQSPAAGKHVDTRNPSRRLSKRLANRGPETALWRHGPSGPARADGRHSQTAGDDEGSRRSLHEANSRTQGVGFTPRCGDGKRPGRGGVLSLTAFTSSRALISGEEMGEVHDVSKLSPTGWKRRPESMTLVRSRRQKATSARAGRHRGFNGARVGRKAHALRDDFEPGTRPSGTPPPPPPPPPETAPLLQGGGAKCCKCTERHVPQEIDMFAQDRGSGKSFGALRGKTVWCPFRLTALRSIDEGGTLVR